MAPPQAGGSSKRGLLVGLGVLVVAALAAGGFLLTQKDDDKSGGGGSGSDTSVPAPDADAITVKDQGGSVYTDKIRNQPRYGYGLVVANRSDQAASDVKVTLDFLDGDDKVLASVDAYVTVLPAKGQIGIGNSVNPGVVQIDPAAIPNIDHFEVRSIEPAGWGPAADQGKVVASNITTDVDDDGFAKVHFEADSTYKRPLIHPTMTVLYRNADGDLIGGETDISTSTLEAEGHFGETFKGRETVEGINADKVDVYVGPSNS